MARTTEPMLGQMRLAWWRDALGKPVDERPRGDAVLTQRFARHKSITTTSIYTHPSDDELVRAVQELPC